MYVSCDLTFLQKSQLNPSIKKKYQLSIIIKKVQCILLNNFYM